MKDPDNHETRPEGRRRKRQGNRETEEDSVSEKQRHGDTQATEATKDAPLATRVTTIQEAIAHALKAGVKDRLFEFARALKALVVTTRVPLPRAHLDSAFAQLWTQAKPKLPPDADFDECRLLFHHAFGKVKAPLGANHLTEAIRRAGALPLPPEAVRYATSAGIQRLVAVCFHLQKLVGNVAFFLSVRDAARIAGTTNLMRASAFLDGLVADGVLIVAEKGTPGGRRATRFRFKSSGQATK